jgi:GH25 family lysozyme M1 (1,4-beta-N-acetylmuramidase)
MASNMTLYIPDGSKWQKDIKLTSVDWDAIGALIWRASSTYVDDTYAWARDQARQHGKPFLPYHALYNNSTMTLERQADLFANTVHDTSLGCMVDWEGWTGNGANYSELLRFVRLIRARGYEVPATYFGYAYWQLQGRPPIAELDTDWVVARYGNQSPTAEYEMASRYVAMNQAYGNETWNWNAGGLKPRMWQYGSRIRWGDRYMDMNAYRGDLASLRAWFTGTAIPDPIPAPIPVPPSTNYAMPIGGLMFDRICCYDVPNGMYAAVYTGGYKVWIDGNDVLTEYQALARIHKQDATVQVISNANMWKALGPVVGPIPPGTDAYGLPL